MRTVYLNGDYVAEQDAKVSIFDRGFMFGDGIYEVTAVIDGQLIDFPGHMQRLRRSLGEIGMTMPLDEDGLARIHHHLIEDNALREGLVYLQVTRGTQDRNFLYPSTDTPQTLVLYTQAKAVIDSPLAKRGLTLISVPDLRWQRSDIKTTQLLYACMAKEMAKAEGADDAWLVRDGAVTEGSSNNAFIVTRDGAVVTRELSRALLPGITRGVLLDLIERDGLRLEERPFTLEEAYAAAEAFVTSSTSFVYPVVNLDGRAIGNGSPGPITQRLRQRYIDRVHDLIH
ncbi:D-amino-acid transaminase [Pseudomonas matsuisoli]|uniref:Aminodeoxychorismate lyase n=1 Tax=Pseudomonas matsuisoli TaxID=1515666 RepID=A0A917UW52_9PSED|nr:D-amino-acid transaminase [Pseudomonas matsuisoli]GGJ89536.1 D-alanine aminotransferase [Pseudomonas matsuisoli]